MTFLQRLDHILKASGWPQERLARELGVSFVTLNAWLNKRAEPRQKAVQRIEQLYLDIVGAEDVDIKELALLKQRVAKLHLSAKTITENQITLDKLTLHLTYHTNTIEGSTMTLSDVDDVIFQHKVLSNRTAVEQAEARNHQAALYWLLEKMVMGGKTFVVDEDLVLGLHLRLMNGIISDAGQYRTHSVRIQGAHVPLANWQKVQELLKQFYANQYKKTTDTIASLAKSHATFEKIHPFSDGNGRTGRLLLFAQALQARLMPPLVVKERRQAYYKYLEVAQTKDDYRSLELFMAQSILFTQTLLDES